MISLPGVAMVLCAVIILFYFIPNRLRLPVCLAAMVLILTLGRLVDLGSIASLSKIASGPMFVCVGLAAALQHGPRRKIPFSALMWPMLGIYSFICVLQLLDRDFAIILRFQWLLLTVSALLVVRTIVDEQNLKRIALSLFIGFTISCLVTLAALVIDPAAAFPGGFGRFKPFGANPNQVSIIYSVTAPAAAYLILRSRGGLVRMLCIGILCIALLQSLLTVSRSSMLILFIGMLPIIMELCRRPILVICSILVIGLVSATVMMKLSELSFHHVDKGIGSRTSKTTRMFPLIEQRPLFGLTTSTQTKLQSEDTNAHNAYVQMLYFGGLVFAIPSFLLFIYSHFSAWKIWSIRRSISVDPLFMGILCAFSFAIFLHGLINNIIHYPTYTWAFMNVLLGMFFCSMYTECYARNNKKCSVSC